MLNKLFAIVLLLASLSVHAAEKHYPPYPDVWGYDLSDYPAMKSNQSRVDAFRMDDGDIWFVFNYEIKADQNANEYILLKFFKKEQEKLNTEQRNTLFQKISEKSISNVKVKIAFKDGSFLEKINNSVPKLCYTPDFLQQFFLKKESNEVNQRYSILVGLPYVNMWLDKGACEVNSGPFFYQKLLALNEVIDLHDGTMLFYSSRGNLIIRLDKDMKTQFKSIHKFNTQHGTLISNNFFIVNYEIIEQLKKKLQLTKGNFNQQIHDDLLLYLKDRTDNK